MPAILWFRFRPTLCQAIFYRISVSAALLKSALLPRLIIAATLLLAATQPCGAQSETRTWTDASGKFSVRAAVERIEGDTVWLKKSDGKVIKVEIKVLSQSDQAAVATLRTKSAANSLRTTNQRSVKDIMKQPCKWDVDGKSLTEFLAVEIPAKVFLDARALHETRVTPNTPITSSFSGTLADGLDSVLMPLELSWAEVDGMIRVTTFEALARSPAIIAYRVRQGGQNLQPAIQTIEGIHPSSWQTTGGPGVVIASGNFLFVRQSAVVHRQISKESGNLLTAVTPPPKPSRLLPPNIRGATTDVYFDKIPLETAMASLSEATGIPIVMSESITSQDALLNRRLTLGLKDANLIVVLDHICSDLEITWRVEKNQIKLLTHQDSNNDPSSYQWKLSAVDKRNVPLLIHLMQSMIEPQSWQDGGGKGTIRVDAASDRLVITNQFSALLKVEKLLQDRDSLHNSR